MFRDPLRDCVGPAPWYWKTFPKVGVDYEWRLANDPTRVSNPILFRDGAPVLEVAIYGRVLSADPGHLLLWGPLMNEGVLVIETFALAALEQLEAGTRADPGVPWIAAVHPLDHLQIPEGLSPGVRERRYAAKGASTLDEVLLLAHGPDGTTTAASIYSWRPGDGVVDVMPQPWFNTEDNDIGYEWITRVKRDPGSGHILGDGIRIPPFELDQRGAWLRRRGPLVPSV